MRSCTAATLRLVARAGTTSTAAGWGGGSDARDRLDSDLAATVYGKGGIERPRAFGPPPYPAGVDVQPAATPSRRSSRSRYGRARRCPPRSAIAAVEPPQRPLDRGPVGLQPARRAVRQVGARRHVAAPPVAPAAGRHLVLRPRRPALEPGHDVLEREVAIAQRQRAAAPDAMPAVALEDAREALRARKAGRDPRLGRYAIPSLTHSSPRRPSVRRSTRPSLSIS